MPSRKKSVEEAVSSGIEAEQAYREAKAAYELAVTGPRKEKIAQARAQVAMQAATVERLKDQLTKHTIISRFDGYVTAEHTEVGQWVKQGDPVAEVVALDEVEVVAYVVEQHVPYVRVGMQVTVRSAGHSRGSGSTGTVTRNRAPGRRAGPDLSGQGAGDESKSTGDVPLLKAGMYARVLVAGRRQATGDARAEGRAGARRPAADGLPRRRRQRQDAPRAKSCPCRCKSASPQGGLIQVTGPLKAGQLVVVQGNERLRPGQDVTIQRTSPRPRPSDAELPADAG